MDTFEYEARSIGSGHATVVVEITSPVPAERAPDVAKRVAERLRMSEHRLCRLLAGRVGPVSKPLRPAKAEILRRILEREGVSVTIRPAGAEPPSAGAPHGAPPPRRVRRFDDVPAAPRAASDAPAFPDAFVAAVLAAMVAVATIGGRPSEPELRAVQLALASMTGTDVGRERIEALASSKGAGDLTQARALMAAMGPTLTAEQRRAGVATLLTVLDVGAWSPTKAEAASELAEALRAAPPAADGHSR
jgi:hypothetical protein